MEEILSCYDSPLGKLWLSGWQDGTLTGLSFDAKDVSSDKSVAVQCGTLPSTFTEVFLYLDKYFSFKADFGTFDVKIPPFALCGTDFEKCVWHQLLKIPYGRTVSYKDVALEVEKQLGKRVSFQAIGRAIGKNPIGIIIPCHRVIGADGKLVGYAGGLENKVWLLRHEGAILL